MVQPHKPRLLLCDELIEIHYFLFPFIRFSMFVATYFLQKFRLSCSLPQICILQHLCDVMWIAVNTGKLAERLAVGVVAYSERTSYKAACTVKGFVEVTVPGYSVDDFYAHFRMTRSTFEVILIWLCRG